ncbi:plastocyanin/azurin family copper-binding protein [Verrucomicrobiota bacterium sgz303538]
MRSFSTLLGCLGSMGLLAACGPSGTSSNSTTGSESKAAAPAAFSGKVHEVKMTGTTTSFSFEPKELTIKQGDKVKWVMGAAGPHNVDFSNPAFADKTKVPEGAKPKLETMGLLVTPLLQVPGQATEIVFGKDLPVGEYNYVCDPHAPLGMIGKITVTP